MLQATIYNPKKATVKKPRVSSLAGEETQRAKTLATIQFTLTVLDFNYSIIQFS